MSKETVILGDKEKKLFSDCVKGKYVDRAGKGKIPVLSGSIFGGQGKIKGKIRKKVSEK